MVLVPLKATEALVALLLTAGQGIPTAGLRSCWAFAVTAVKQTVDLQWSTATAFRVS